MTEEEFRVIGNPSELGVQEAVFAVMHLTDDEVTTADAVAKLMVLMDLSEHEARRRVMVAISNGEVGVTTEGGFTLWLDPVTVARIERRYNYWILHKQGSDGFRPHVANEEAHARRAIWMWAEEHDGDLPTFDDLVDTICEMLGADCNRHGGRHIALNALDAGAVYMTSHPTRSEEVRFATTEDTEQEGLGR